MGDFMSKHFAEMVCFAEKHFAILAKCVYLCKKEAKYDI